MRSFLLVFIQFFCLGLILLTGPLIPANPVLLAVELIGIGLGIWAVVAMGIRNFNITPEPLAHARLVVSGPYRLIRHPMYLALLIATFPLLMAPFSPLRLFFWLVLLIDLLLKVRLEESLLAERLEGYHHYQERTYRILPFIY